MYTIKEAAARTGIPIALLRAWERRYSVVTPARTPSGYRLYDDVALDRLRTMRRLVDDGWQPAAAAAAIVSGTARVTPRGAAASESEPDSAPDGSGAALPGAIVDFVSAAADLDVDRIERLLDDMLAVGSFERVADQLLLPALAAVGEGWADGRISVAGEHAASQAVLRRFGAAFQAAGRPPRGPGAIIVGLPPGARHELGALAFAVAARRDGLPVVYLGADLPVADWVAAAGRARPSAAVIGTVTASDVHAAVDVATALRAADRRIVVAFGGRTSGRAAARAADRIGPGSAPGPRDTGDRPPSALPAGLEDAVVAIRQAIGADPIEG
jgi:methanogenic corrinoid protein MtbC1